MAGYDADWVEQNPASLFDADGTPRERRYYGEALALLDEFGYDRDHVNPDAPKWIVFTGSHDSKAAMFWDAERSAWQIVPCPADQAEAA